MFRYTTLFFSDKETTSMEFLCGVFARSGVSATYFCGISRLCLGEGGGVSNILLWNFSAVSWGGRGRQQHTSVECPSRVLGWERSEENTSVLQSQPVLVFRLLLEK